MSWILSHGPFFAVAILLAMGVFILFSSRNLIKRMIGLAVFQSSLAVFYIVMGKVSGGTAAILLKPDAPAVETLAARLDPAYVEQFGVRGVVYSNPLPHVLILTAIVVGVATLAVGLAIAVRVREAYGTIEGDMVARLDRHRELTGETKRADGSFDARSGSEPA
jgi:multicomponent Na+:H+ antiporter subunit C